jgi:hypothetical protein
MGDCGVGGRGISGPLLQTFFFSEPRRATTKKHGLLLVDKYSLGTMENTQQQRPRRVKIREKVGIIRVQYMHTYNMLRMLE